MDNETTFGIFEYHSTGFFIQLKDEIKNIIWDEIERVEGYKLDLFETDEICLDIVLKDSIITISEETKGWGNFLRRIEIRFSSIEKDWDLKITQPPFATNNTILFSK